MAVTLFYTVGDLRFATTPQGAFPSRDGARLYGLVLGIPRSALHVEAVTTDEPVVVDVNRDTVSSAARAGALADELAELVGDEALLARALEQLRKGTGPGPEVVAGLHADLAHATEDLALVRAEIAELREGYDAQGRELALAEEEVKSLTEARDKAEARADELVGDLAEYEELKTAHDLLREKARTLLDALADPLGLTCVRSDLLRDLEDAADAAKTLHHDLDSLATVLSERSASTEEPSAARAAATYIEELASETEAKARGFGEEGFGLLRAMGVGVVPSEFVRRPVRRSETAPTKGKREAKAEPSGASFIAPTPAPEAPVEPSPMPSADAPAPGPAQSPPLPATRVWIAADAWDALAPEDREDMEEPIGGCPVAWEGREGWVTAEVDHAVRVCLVGLAEAYGVTLHEGPEVPGVVARAVKAKAARKPRAPRAKSHRQTPCPEADELTEYSRTCAVYLDGEGWHAEVRFPGESSPAWDARVRGIARDAATQRVRTYDRAGRCTWDSLDTPSRAIAPAASPVSEQSAGAP